MTSLATPPDITGIARGPVAEQAHSVALAGRWQAGPPKDFARL